MGDIEFAAVSAGSVPRGAELLAAEPVEGPVEGSAEVKQEPLRTGPDLVKTCQELAPRYNGKYDWYDLWTRIKAGRNLPPLP